MNTEQIEQLEKKYRGAKAEEIIQLAIEIFENKLSFATSLSVEDQVVTYMLSMVSSRIDIFTLDTGRLFQETYDTIEKTNKFFNINIRIIFPEKEQVENMVNEKGINCFYENAENRKECCTIRKTKPLLKTLQDYEAWMTGLRREQSVTRFGMKKIEKDTLSGLVKFNPLADWTEQETYDFIEKHGIPFNELQNKGFRSIGCLPCTRPVNKDDDIRAGRWWWEKPEQKECGLHKK